jgi:hypothetical protein
MNSAHCLVTEVILYSCFQLHNTYSSNPTNLICKVLHLPPEQSQKTKNQIEEGEWSSTSPVLSWTGLFRWTWVPPVPAAWKFPGSWGLYPGSVCVYRPETSDSMGGVPSCLDCVQRHTLAGSCPQESGHLIAWEAKMPTLVSHISNQCTRNVAEMMRETKSPRSFL